MRISEIKLWICGERVLIARQGGGIEWFFKLTRRNGTSLSPENSSKC